MKIQYFQDTDTLYIELNPGPITQTQDLDENTLLDLDGDGKVCAITVEHARDPAGIPSFSYKQITASATPE